MTSKVLFLDIDGVVLPGRAYLLPKSEDHTPYVTTFDPCAVSMLNAACKKQDRKIVLHSSWIKHQEPEWLLEHFGNQGIDTCLFHEDWQTVKGLKWRYDRVDEWLARHREVTDFVILDDEPETREGEPEGKYSADKNLLLTDFDEGITLKIYRRILDGTFPRKD